MMYIAVLQTQIKNVVSYYSFSTSLGLWIPGVVWENTDIRLTSVTITQGLMVKDAV